MLLGQNFSGELYNIKHHLQTLKQQRVLPIIIIDEAQTSAEFLMT